MHDQTITQLGAALRSGKLSAVTLAEHYLARIESLDSKLNAFRLVCPQRALAQAEAAQIRLDAGDDLGPLHGIPYAAKDLYDVAGLPTTAGSSQLADNVADHDCTVVAELSRAGMVLLGKTNTVQFAYGGAGVNHDHGTPHNPWHSTHHLPGGSSSGSGVAVASGLAPMALGSDTGGSVRIPASFCSTTGLKTTVGRISRDGVYPLSYSLDSVGPLTRSVEDAALIYQCVHGPDAKDPTTDHRPRHDVLADLERGIAGLRVAFAESVFWDEAHPEVVAAVRVCGPVFESLGAAVTSIAFEEAEQALALNPLGLVIAAEAYAVNRNLLERHFDDLDPVVASRMVKGQAVPAHEFIQITREWHRLRARAIATLADIDVLLCPTVMIPPPPLAEADRDKDAYSAVNLNCLRNTAIGNILNLCGLSVPCGFTAEGLPIGLMIYAKPFDEALVLRVGHAFQRATEWHQRTPALDWVSRAGSSVKT